MTKLGMALPNATRLPAAVLDRFTLLRPPRTPASATTTARELCRHYHPVSYDTLTHTDADRTAAYVQALATVAPGACVLDLGTGAHATLALAALNAGATLVVAFELNERALRNAVDTLRQQWADAARGGGAPRVHRLAPGGPIAWRYATNGQQVWVVRGDVTVTCAHADVVRLLQRWWQAAQTGGGEGTAPRIVLAHELLDDLASSEDVSAIVGAVQRTLRKVVNDVDYLPVSVPEQAQTMACPLHVLATDDNGATGAGAKRSHAAAFAPPAPLPDARLVAGGAALYTHAALPRAWRVAQCQPVETLAFARTRCELGDITHVPVTFVCDRRPVHALALTLRIDLDATTVYDVLTATRSNWRTVLVAVPTAVNGSQQPDEAYRLTVQLTMHRGAMAQLSYTLRFRCNRSGAEAATTIAWADVVAAVGCEGKAATAPAAAAKEAAARAAAAAATPDEEEG